MSSVSSNTLEFLHALAAHNTRDWYHEHKAWYQEAKVDFERWVGELIRALTDQGLAPLHALEPKQAMYRIFRDVRFHPQKAPYNPWFSAMLGPGGRKTVGAAFYIRIEPGRSRAGAGFATSWSGEQMAALRQEIDYNPEPLETWVGSSSFARYFEKLEGDALKRPPKGYAADHPHLDWLRQKEWWVQHPVAPSLESSEELIPYLLDVYTAAAPLVQYLNQAIEEVN